MSVWIYERQTDAIRVFVSEDDAKAWLLANDPEGVAFEFQITRS